MLSECSADASAVAQRLWSRTTREARSASDLLDAVERLFSDLRLGLLPWEGGERYVALVDRAVDRAEARYPQLSGFSVDKRGESPEHHSDSLGDAQILAAVEEVTKGVVTAVIAAVSQLTGHALAVRMVDQIDYSRAFNTASRGVGASRRETI